MREGIPMRSHLRPVQSVSIHFRRIKMHDAKYGNPDFADPLAS